MPRYGKTGRGRRVEKGRRKHTGGRPLEEWCVTNTPIILIEMFAKYDIRKHIKTIAKKRRPMVVDWGCGIGNAIAEIAAEIPKTRCYGFSADSYTEWNHKKGVKFIHATGEDFSKYFKDGSIDVLYSHLGLLHFFKSKWDQGKSADAYIRLIIRKLRVGGLLIITPPIPTITEKKFRNIKDEEVIVLTPYISCASVVRRIK